VVIALVYIIHYLPCIIQGPYFIWHILFLNSCSAYGLMAEWVKFIQQATRKYNQLLSDTKMTL